MSLTQPSSRSRGVRIAVVVLPLCVLALAACSKDDSGDSFSSKEKSTTTEKETTSTEKETTTTESSGEKDDSAAPDQSGVEPWQRTAQDLRDKVGSTEDFRCPAGGTESAVWGVNVYTDDSSVCTAAVQVGVITLKEGGTVTIKVLAGQDSYEGGEANGITSNRYGSWGGSFEFPDADKLDIGATIDWGTAANEFTGRTETTFTVECPPNGTQGSLWGSNPYTADSSICTGAVHSGVITLEGGGEVTFALAPGQESYKGTEANGVSSGDWGSYGDSFEIRK